MPTEVLFAVLILAPFAGFLCNGLRWRSHNAVLAGTIASGAALISFACSVLLVSRLSELPEGQRHLVAHFFSWLQVADFKVQFGVMLDPINALMALVITGVGSLIHIFSIGYMSHDERPAKYFAYLNLFLMNMLILVLADNLLLLFVGWEGVGLCSYLLIGFWFSDSAKAAAGMKAFITNRIGDAAFLIGLFLLFQTFNTVQFGELLARLPQVAEVGWWGPISMACLALFIGATGKSAQIPLYVWLPDAMAGPTPVSALIHAATMVTAGIYLIVRLSALFVLAPHVMGLIAVIGAATALLGAIIGFAQFDIKKILAYSTVSQLGYMFLAVGVGAFNAAMFHLMTHAFFKALMFLGSGSVIHAMHEEQDVRKMGGLKKYLPITYWTFFMGWLAIIGMPPFAGFFSKDEILSQAFSSPFGHPLLWLAGWIGALCTAFYMTRLMALVFWGPSRFGHDKHPHESPWTMALPLCVLGVLSVVGGWIGIPEVISAILPGHPGNFLEHWLEPVVTKIAATHGASELNVGREWGLMAASVVFSMASAFFAYDSYVRHPDRIARWVSHIKGLHRAVANKFYVDEFYDAGIIQPLIKFSKLLWVYVDVNVIDQATYFVSDLVKGSARGFRSFQNGNLQQYALYIVLGMVVTITYVLVG
jgi:NADH-quinone oxidoreductase subunit L